MSTLSDSQNTYSLTSGELDPNARAEGSNQVQDGQDGVDYDCQVEEGNSLEGASVSRELREIYQIKDRTYRRREDRLKGISSRMVNEQLESSDIISESIAVPVDNINNNYEVDQAYGNSVLLGTSALIIAFVSGYFTNKWITARKEISFNPIKNIEEYLTSRVSKNKFWHKVSGGLIKAKDLNENEFSEIKKIIDATKIHDLSKVGECIDKLRTQTQALSRKEPKNLQRLSETIHRRLENSWAIKHAINSGAPQNAQSN
jgi:hypothetical protein